jgi:hypothetical protein
MAMNVIETAFRQTAMDRGLTTFKAVDANAGTSRLAFTAATAGFALAGTDTTAYAHPALFRAWVTL